MSKLDESQPQFVDESDVMHTFKGTAHVDTERCWIIETVGNKILLVPAELAGGLIDYGSDREVRYRGTYRLPRPGEVPRNWKIKCAGVVVTVRSARRMPGEENDREEAVDVVEQRPVAGGV